MPGVKPRSGEDDALKCFVRQNKESALKTKPKVGDTLSNTSSIANLEGQGFIADHRDIELLKLRKFTLTKKIRDELLLADDTQEQVTEVLRPLVGFVG
jgi:hypothetical protein